MSKLILSAGAAFVALISVGPADAGSTQIGVPLLVPGSAGLVTNHFSARCYNAQRFERGPGERAERATSVQRVVERPTTYRGRPAVLMVTSATASPPWVDSMLVYRDGLAPILETYRGAADAMRFEYDGAHVRFTNTTRDSAPVVKEHRYQSSVFSFQQLDAVIRSLPLHSGYAALLPLYSEGDDSVEVDTVRVVSRGADGVWKIRFADPAIVATVGVDEKTRAQVAYSHTFRTSGPSWKVGTVWRQAYSACAER
ncbi:MAG: hypothetical protein ABJF01_25140 [bacterium]